MPEMQFSCIFAVAFAAKGPFARFVRCLSSLAGDFFCSRVGGIVDLRQALEIQRGVDLGSGDRSMSQQLLHRTQIAGALQHV